MATTSKRSRTNSTTSLSTIFLDLDNTLIQTRKGDKLACNKLSDILWEKYAIPRDVAINSCSSYLRNFRKCPAHEEMQLDQWRIFLWAQALGDQYHNLATDVYLKWLQLRYHYLAITPDIKLILNKLRQQYMLGLITNGDSSAQWEKIQRLDLSGYFDIILVSGDMECEKPNRKIFQEACQYLGVEAKQCMMVGDKLETDILGGIEAELGATVWTPLSSPELHPNDPHPDYIIKSFLDLLTILPPLESRKPIVRSRNMNNGKKSVQRSFSLPDFDDCNSNESDGS